jgi:hypothetical protein
MMSSSLIKTRRSLSWNTGSEATVNTSEDQDLESIISDHNLNLYCQGLGAYKAAVIGYIAGN